jgi:hypothetical protein
MEAAKTPTVVFTIFNANPLLRRLCKEIIGDLV